MADPLDIPRDAPALPAGWLRKEMISACRELRTRPWLTDAHRADIDAALEWAKTTRRLR